MRNPAGKGRSRRITVSVDETDIAELQTRATRDRLPLSVALLIAARDGFGRPTQSRPTSDAWDEGYDHSLQQELLLLNLIAAEQTIKLLESLSPYSQTSADALLIPAAQAAQHRIARGIPDALGGRSDDKQ